MPVVDAHLDIAYNGLKYGRDPLLNVQQLREQETPDPDRGVATVSFPQRRVAEAVIIFGTSFTAHERSAALMWGDTSFS